MTAITKTEKTFRAVANGNTTAADIMAATKIDSANTQGFLRSLLRQKRIVKLKKDGHVTWKAAKAKKTKAA